MNLFLAIEDVTRDVASDQFSSSPGSQSTSEKYGSPSANEQNSPLQQVGVDTEFSYFSPWNPKKTGKEPFSRCI